MLWRIAHLPMLHPRKPVCRMIWHLPATLARSQRRRADGRTLQGQGQWRHLAMKLKHVRHLFMTSLLTQHALAVLYGHQINAAAGM